MISKNVGNFQILMKPMDYGLSNSPLSDVAERNLRVVATTMLYLVRRISISRGQGIMVSGNFILDI